MARPAAGVGWWHPLAWLLAVLLSAPALAQSLPPASGSGQRRPAISARFGWNATIPAERFAPIWITINSGNRALDGTVSLTLPQDAVQDIRLVAPFAAAAGHPATVEFAAALPAGTDRAVVQVRDRSGRVLATQSWTANPGSRDLLFPSSLFIYEDVIASVGAPGFVIAAKAWTPGILPIPTRQTQGYSRGEEQQITDLFRHISVADVPPTQLPTAWIAYDSLRCLVVNADAARAISPAAAQAIRDWVIDGGRLVVLASAPGAAWIDWLSDPTAATLDASSAGTSDALGATRSPLPVELGNARTIASPEMFGSVVAGAPRSSDVAPPAVVSPRLSVRPLALTPRGRSLGWRAHWELDDPSTPGTALLAEGPLGLGFVCIVGFDPADVVLGVDREATAQIWKHVLTGALGPFAGNDRHDSSPGWIGQQASGDTEAARAALTSGLDHLADVRVPSGSAFYAIAGACFLLALLVGPVDAVVLKRLGRRPLSWLTALAWIGLASLASYIVPTIGQEGAGRLGRLNVIDQVHDARGLPILSRQTALTGIFSARAGSASLETHDATAWWRGVSSVTRWYYGQQPPATAPPMTAAVGDVDRPARTPGAPGRPMTPIPIRASAPRSIPMATFTFRTMLERGVGALPISARIASESEQSWRVSIAGLPEGATIESARLELGGRAYRLDFSTDTESGHRHATASGPGTPRTADSGWRPVAPSGQGFQVAYAYASTGAGPIGTAPGLAFHLMGPDSRGDALDRLRSAGHWAILHLLIESMPIDAATTAADSSRRTVIARLALPLGEAVQADPPAVRWDPTGVSDELRAFRDRLPRSGPNSADSWPRSESPP